MMEVSAEEKVRFSAFLSTPKPAPPPAVKPAGDWFDWVDNQGNTVQLCLLIDANGGPPKIMADRNGNVSVHDPFPWLAA